MEKEFCTYEQALALKELGFNSEESFGLYYNHKGELEYCHNWNEEYPTDWYGSNSKIYAPLIQQAFRFFREKYGLSYYIVSFFIEGQFECWIQSSGNIGGASVCIDTKNTYEEAEQACLNKLIGIAGDKA